LEARPLSFVGLGGSRPRIPSVSRQWVEVAWFCPSPRTSARRIEMATWGSERCAVFPSALATPIPDHKRLKPDFVFTRPAARKDVPGLPSVERREVGRPTRLAMTSALKAQGDISSIRDRYLLILFGGCHFAVVVCFFNDDAL
jgi:hypothetical protein